MSPSDATWPRHFRIPPQTHPEKAPHWLGIIEERSGEVLLSIPEVGGQVDASLALGEDDWLSAWLKGRPGVAQNWTTTWTLADAATAERVIDALVRETGGAWLDAKQYANAYGELYTAVWNRVLKR